MTSNRAKRRAEARARARRKQTVLLAVFATIALAGAAFGINRLATADEGDDGAATDDASPDAELRPRPAEVREGSEPVEGQPRFSISPVDEYRIVYRVDDYAGGTQVTTTEEIRVRRPFDARIDRRQGPPPGDEDEVSTTIGRFGLLSVPGGGGRSVTLPVPPEPATSDLRFDIALDDLVADEAVARREWREVAGERCRVHRFGEPVASGDASPWNGDADEYADLCLTEEGLLIEELWVTSGRALRRRVAVEVATASGLDDELLAITSELLPREQGGGAVVELDPDSAPEGASWVLDPPQSYQRMGRYGADAPQQGAQPAASGSALIDVFTRGRDVILLEQGTTPPSTSAAGAATVDAGALGEAQLILGVRLNEVRITREGGQMIRVRGTVPPDELLSVARAVRETSDGTGLRPRTP